MSGSKKIIAVMGATGFQGGAVIKAFKNLRNDEFLVRAITRNPSSERAQAIAPFVDEVVTADANDEESMVAAFDGCYGVFIMSDYWQDRDVRHEMTVSIFIASLLVRVFQISMLKTDPACTNTGTTRFSAIAKRPLRRQA